MRIAEKTHDRKHPPRFCSFCGRPDHECIMVICGPNWNFICDVCVGHCAAIIVAKDEGYYQKVIDEMRDALKAKTLKQATLSKGEKP